MMPRALWLAVFVALVGCNEKVNVNVSCVTVLGPAVDCALTETVGKADVEVCWDFTVQCGNGEKVTAPRSCQHVSGGGSATYTIPGASLAGLEQCGGNNPTATVTNLTINGEPSR